MSPTTTPALIKNPKGTAAVGHPKTIVVAEHAGFCYGVRMAVDKAFELAETATTPVYVLGELIHNPQVVGKLKEKGVKTVQSVDEIPAGSTCLIRTHGVDPTHVDVAQEKSIAVNDATCPDVRRVQDSAVQLAEEGYVVVIVGKANHPEVIGIQAHCERIEGAKILTVTSPEEFDQAFAGISKNKVGIVSQTTQLEASFKELVGHAAQQCRELKVFNTICPATFKRQYAAEDLAKQVELMVVVGGKNSSNTSHLAEVATLHGTPALHVETAEELATHADTIDQFEVIGVTAGASTPDWLIKEVMTYLEGFNR